MFFHCIFFPIEDFFLPPEISVAGLFVFDSQMIFEQYKSNFNICSKAFPKPLLPQVPASPRHQIKGGKKGVKP